MVDVYLFDFGFQVLLCCVCALLFSKHICHTSLVVTDRQRLILLLSNLVSDGTRPLISKKNRVEAARIMRSKHLNYFTRILLSTLVVNIYWSVDRDLQLTVVDDID
jgi:hypothetical protein